MKKPDLIIFNQHSSYITIDIANAFYESGVYGKIVLMTGVVNVRETELNPEIKVIRTLKYNKKNIITRFGSWIFAYLHFILLVNLKYRAYKLFLVSNPPLVAFTPNFCKNQFSTLIFDVYPDALTAGGFVSKDSFLFKMWKKSNIKFYKNADRVFTISEGMKSSISQYCTPDKIEVVNLWSSFESQTIPKEENLFIKQQQLENKFIVMYSGNMGKGCGLETIIEVADTLKEQADIVFLFVGEGWMLNDLKLLTRQKQLQNIIFLPYQPASILKHSLSAADISVISLPPGVSAISIPNKTYSLIALGMPVLSLSMEDSDLSNLIWKYNIGKSFSDGDIISITEYINEVRSNEGYALMLQNNAIKCAEFFTKTNASNFTRS